MKANAKKETIYANIIMLAVFFFAFLGTEYLFDNCMMYVTDASGVVRAQNQMLGVPVNIRGEALSLEQFAQLSNIIYDHRSAV